MSRLGAKLKVQKPSEEAVKKACEWALFFMLLFHDRTPGSWYRDTTDLANRYPNGSYRYVFWWSVRMFFQKGQTVDWTDFREYLEWKMSQYDKKFVHRVGPKW